MGEQLSLYDEENAQNQKARQRRNWERKFQRWSDKMSQDGTVSAGKCGYGVMCDFCTCDYRGMPCVRSLNAMLRETGGQIDYERADFMSVWKGYTGKE